MRFDRMRLALAIFAAATIVAAPAAHAFTYDTKSNTNSDGTPKFADPDEKIERFGSGDAPAQSGGTTFRFNVGPSNGLDQSGRFTPAWGSQPFPDRR